MANVLLICYVILVVTSTYYAFPQSTEMTKNSTKEERESVIILKFLFQKYGSKDMMSFEGYEHLLHNIRLGRMIFDHGLVNHTVKEDSYFNEFHPSHEHRKETDQAMDTNEHGHNDGKEHENSNNDEKHNGHTHNHQKRSLTHLNEARSVVEKVK